jgi:hypothetical protein
LEDISNSCIVLLRWAKSRVDREKELLQAKTSNSQKNCTRYQKFSGILNADELEVYKEAIIATSFWWDIFSPILKLVPHWSNKRFEKRKEYLKYIVNYWQNDSQQLQNELDLLMAEYDIKTIEEIFLFVNVSLLYSSFSMGNHPETGLRMVLSKKDGLVKDFKEIRIFRFSDEYSRDILINKFLEKLNAEELGKICANQADSYYPPIDKHDCINSSVRDVLRESQ